MSIFPTRILLATDSSEDAQQASRMAIELANSTDSELHIVHVRPSVSPHAPGYYVGPYILEHSEREQEMLNRQAQELLNTQAEKIRAAGGSIAQTHLRTGRPDAEIVAQAEEIGAGLIVVGSRGLGGMRRALMGSVSGSVVRHAHCPVLVVRKEEKQEEAVGLFPTKILLATDGSKDAELAARAAIELANKTHSELHVVYVGEFVPSPRAYPAGKLEQILERLTHRTQSLLGERIALIAAAGGEVSGDHARVGWPAQEIIALAEEIKADLIVVGSRGLGGMRRALLGSVSESVVRDAHCPVLMVRQPEQ